VTQASKRQCLLQFSDNQFQNNHVLSLSNHKGEPIGDFRKAFDSACAAAGLQGILPHDLRRSAVRNFIRAGVKETVAMRLSGHRTRSVFDRYNIVSEDDLIDASAKLQEFLVEAIKDEKVVPIQK
jgi:integrase